jgi:low affinity Fe/Cu permease
MLAHAVSAVHRTGSEHGLNTGCAKEGHSVAEFFRCAAQRSADAFGSPWSFALAVAVVLIWAATGPLFGYSDTWQLVINTGTTIVTFLTVFLIQNAQNRDAKAFHLKLDELIHALRGARNELIDLEHLTDDELEHIQKEFQRLAKTRQPLVNGTRREQADEQPQAQTDE